MTDGQPQESRRARKKRRVDLGRPRRSTIVLAVLFLGVLVLYIWVRPPSAADTARQAGSQQHVTKYRAHPKTFPSYPSQSATPTRTPSSTRTATPSRTPTPTQTPAQTPTQGPTQTPTPSSSTSTSPSLRPTGSSPEPTSGPAIVPTSSP